MTPNELKQFMIETGLNDKQLAEILGVTRMAVNHWLGGTRTISLTITRLIRMFHKNPDLMSEF